MAIDWNSTVASLMPKLGFKIHDQIKMGWEGMRSGAVKEVTFTKKNNNIQIDDGAAKAAWTADFGTVQRSGRSPTEATYQTKALVGGVEIGLQAHDETESSAEGVQLLKHEVRKMINGMTLMRAHAFYNYAITTLAATVSAGASSFTASDVTKYLPGMSYEVVRSGTVIETFKVEDRTIPTTAGGTGTITFGSVTTVEWSSGDIIQSLGAEANAPKGLADVAGTATLFGVAGTTRNWAGMAINASSAEFSKDKLEDLEDARFAKCNGTSDAVVLLSKRTARKIYRADKDLTGFGASNHDPKGKTVQKIDGMDMIVDQPAGDTDVFLHDSEGVKLHTSLKLAPPGSSNSNWKQRDLRLQENSAGYILDMRLTQNIRPERRSSSARYHNFTI